MADETRKVTDLAREDATNADNALRRLRGRLDDIAAVLTGDKKKAVLDASDESTKILARLFKVQEAMRKAFQ